MASLPDMYSCWKSYWALQLWLLCVLSSLQLSLTAISWNQCSYEGLVTDTVGIFGLMPNLTVMCERDVAHLNFSAGGNIVQSLRAAQECTVLSTNETIFDQDREKIYSLSTSKQHQQWSISPPHLPQDLDIECHYFGCYYIDKYDEKYDDVDYDDIIHIVILPNATCTFSQLATISSSITPSTSSLSLSSSSFLTTSPTESSTLPTIATSVRKTPSEVISTHKPTHHTSRFTVQGSQTVTESWKSPTSISTVSSHSISTVPSQPSSGSVKSEWIILAVLTIAVLVTVLVITFMSCLLFTSKRYFNSSIKQGIYYDPNESRDKGFTGERIMDTLGAGILS